MKVSLNLAQQFSNVDLTKIGKDVLLEKIGAQLGAIDEVEEWGPRYEGTVVAKVVSCKPHPNADKLQICLIDDGKAVKHVKRGSDGLVQVVCGAPNVYVGQLVAWLPPGVIVPATVNKEPLQLEVREIRGQMSNGMLASASELGIGDDHSGLLEIADKDAKPGTPFKKLYGLDDTVVDIENKMFTHRPDCFGILGVARELAGIQGKQFKSPDWYLHTSDIRYERASVPLAVKNPIPKLVPRFMAQIVEGIEVKQSPAWLRAGLARVGIRPINNIVDWSNFYMYLTAQPTHAFDYDKLVSKSGSIPTLGPRMAHDGEKLSLLGGKTITLTKEDMVIATDKEAVALAGVMGGAETEVDENTKTIVIEAATFDMYTVRRTSMRHGLFTDAVTRFNKGQSPWQNDRVLAHMVRDMKEAGARPTDAIFDVKHTSVKPFQPVRVTAQFINERLGLSLSASQIHKLLSNVEFKVHTIGKQLAVTPPFWRTDISIAEDVVEEVGRLYGYDHLPLQLPGRDLTPSRQNELLGFKNNLRTILSRAGANEVLTYSFVHGDLLDKVDQKREEAFELSNAISPDLQYYRLSLIPSLLEKVHPNIKAGYGEFALFEIGKSHIKGKLAKDEKVPEEYEVTALAYASKNANQGAAYYQARVYLDELAAKLGLTLVYEPIKDKPKYAVTSPFAYERSAFVRDEASGTFIGVIGEFTATTRRNLKLPAQAAGFEIGTQDLLTASQKQASRYVTIPRYPRVEQDICLKVKVDLPFIELENLVRETLDEHAHGAKVQLSAIDIYQRQDDEQHKQITFRVSVASYERTLTDEMVGRILDEIAKAAHQKFSAEVV